MASDRMAKAVTRNLTGCLLVAAPHWRDPAFDRSVCLIVHHGAQGAIGVMLNRSLPYDGKLIWQVMGQSGSIPWLTNCIWAGPVRVPWWRYIGEDLAEFTSAQECTCRADGLSEVSTDRHRLQVEDLRWPGHLATRTPGASIRGWLLVATPRIQPRRL